MEGGWWQGTTNKDGKRGFFPDNYVKVISDTNSTSTETPLRGKKFRVKYNYIPANVDELELHVNDIVEVISEIEEGWWEGKLRNTIGVFPSNFVTKIPTAEKDTIQCSEDPYETKNEVLLKNLTNDGPILPPKPKQEKEMCKVLFPYEAKHEDELTLKENDVILLLSTDLPDKGWWKGQLDGKIGVFPDNFVKLITVDEDTLGSSKSSLVETTNKMSDGVPKLPSYNVAALRKSVQPEYIRKPIVSIKPSPTEQTKSSSEKISSSPNRNTSISSGPVNQTSSLIKSDYENSRKDSSNLVNEPPRGKSFNTVTSINEKLNSELQAAFASQEAETVIDGTTSSKMYKIEGDEYSTKKERAIFEVESVTDREFNLNSIGRSELLSHPTASRAKAPKRRPPSGINFKEDNDLVVPSNKHVESTKHFISVNGTADPVHNKVKSFPWVEELKLNQAKKNSMQVNLKSGFTSKGSNVTFRFQRPISMYSGDSSDQNFSSTVQENNDVPMISTQVSTLPDNNSDKFVTLPANEWNALNEKISKLEQRLEQQVEFFRRSIDQLKIKLAKEIENRLEMKNEMDKLTDLVTQV